MPQTEATWFTQAWSHELLQQNESFKQIDATQLSQLETRADPVVQKVCEQNDG
jgi:hypothetical protein